MLITATSQASDGGDAVVDAGEVHEQRVDGQVDDEADAADEPEADQLQPVGGPAHAVEQAHVRPDLDGRGVLAHESG